MNLAWFIFYGRLLHMTREEVINTPVGEMSDMITCYSVFNGAAVPKGRPSFDEFLELE